MSSPSPEQHPHTASASDDEQPALLVTESSTESLPASLGKPKAKFSHSSELQLEYLVQWLEQPGNFALLARPTREQVAENANANTKRLKKTDGYKSLAQYMNYKAQTQWTDKIACSRYKSFMASYYRAKRQRPLYLPPIYKRVDTLIGGDYQRDELPKVELQTSTSSFHTGIREMSKSVDDKTSVRTPDSDVEMENSNLVNNQDEEMMLQHERASVKSAESSLAAENQSSLADDNQSSLVEGHSALAVEGHSSLAVEEHNSPPTQTEALHLSEKTPNKSPEDFLEGKAVTITTTMPDNLPMNEKMVWLESQRLAVKQQELELKQLKQTQRVEMIVKLAAAGKTAEEVREYLAVMDQFE